ncbi:MAG TPA: DUF1365 domain-containing protein [Burkholderiaceae bacterium]|nr:DUF1365 domain-containing protein [Burkholderiaceae bacterium]
MSGAATVAPGPAPESVYAGTVMHQRLRPRRHRLQYRMFSLLLDLDGLDALQRRLRWLSVNRFNLFAFHERDHGDGRAHGLADWVRAQLQAAGRPAAASIRLLAMPRVLGYGFNPLSLHFCHGADGHLHSVLYEVHNTFGERHVYLEAVDDAQTGADARLVQRCDKAFHVSPFLPLALAYRFRLLAPTAGHGEFDLAIDVLERDEVPVADDRDRRVLVAHYAAKQQPLSDRTLLRLAATHPLLTLKVIAGIHWEALKLLLKGLRLYTHPGANTDPAAASGALAATVPSASAASTLKTGS